MRNLVGMRVQAWNRAMVLAIGPALLLASGIAPIAASAGSWVSALGVPSGVASPREGAGASGEDPGECRADLKALISAEARDQVRVSQAAPASVIAAPVVRPYSWWDDARRGSVQALPRINVGEAGHWAVALPVEYRVTRTIGIGPRILGQLSTDGLATDAARLGLGGSWVAGIHGPVGVVAEIGAYFRSAARASDPVVRAAGALGVQVALGNSFGVGPMLGLTQRTDEERAAGYGSVSLGLGFTVAL